MSKNYVIIIQSVLPLIDVLSTTSAEKRCLQTGRVCDVVEIPQSRMATATSRPPARDIRDTVNPTRDFDQSAMLTSYRAWDYVLNRINGICIKLRLFSLTQLHFKMSLAKWWPFFLGSHALSVELSKTHPTIRTPVDMLLPGPLDNYPPECHTVYP